MYKWQIDFILKSGMLIGGVYKGPENNSLDVAQKLLLGKNATDIVGLFGELDNHQTFIVVGEIAAFDISEREEAK